MEKEKKSTGQILGNRGHIVKVRQQHLKAISKDCLEFYLKTTLIYVPKIVHKMPFG